MELNSILGKDDFLKLFMAQVQNQNPLEPMDSLDFTNQLAMFSNLEQLQQVNEKLDSLADLQLDSEISRAVGYIGKDAVTYGNGFTVSEGVDEYTFDYDLLTDATDVLIFIKDSDGETVRILEEGDRYAGANKFGWNGEDTDGNKVPAGDYTYVVTGLDPTGEAVASRTYSVGKVTGVSFEDGQAVLEVNGASVSLSDLTQAGRPHWRSTGRQSVYPML